MQIDEKYPFKWDNFEICLKCGVRWLDLSRGSVHTRYTFYAEEFESYLTWIVEFGEYAKDIPLLLRSHQSS